MGPCRFVGEQVLIGCGGMRAYQPYSGFNLLPKTTFYRWFAAHSQDRDP